MEARNREPEILKIWIKKWQRKMGLTSWRNYQAFSLWRRVIEKDKKLTEHTLPKKFSSNILEVIVDSPVDYYELINFRKYEILKNIQELGGKKMYIKDIRYIFSEVLEQE